MKTPHPSSLTLKTKIGFGICDVGGNLFFTVIAFHLAIYLTDTVGLAAGLMGVALLIGRIVDAVTDPLMGYISDRTKSRWGRRRPYLFFGSIPLFLFMALMFSTPALESQRQLFIWVAVTFSLLSTAYTVVNIPYGALTPELTRDFHERTVLNGFRMSFAVVGTLIGAGAALPIIGLFPDQRTGYSAMGIIFGAVMLLTAWITVFTVKEPARDETAGKPSKGNPLKDYTAAFKNIPFLLILIPWALFITGVTVLSSMLKYLFDYVIRDPGGVTFALLIMLVCALAAIPLWVKIAKKIGKKRSYMIGMGILSVCAMIIAFFSDKVSTSGLYILMVFAGIGLSTHYIIPYALIPDAVEWDVFKTGIRREGIYYGLWTFISKLGQGLSGLLIGIVLSGSGYVANVAQGEKAILGIRFLMGPIPALIFLVGIVVLKFYPITEEVYNRKMSESEKTET
ncbi:MAG: MFS transporter [Spirochaetales bacterium]|nr:MFS transporter [Spirochaetales bacterium]